MPEKKAEPRAKARPPQGVGERLVEALLDQKLLGKTDLEKALEVQKQKGGSLSHVLVMLKLVEPKLLAVALSRALDMPIISLARIELDAHLAELIPRKIAFHYQIVPISRMGAQMTVAMADPLNILALDHLSQSTGMSLTPLITTPEEVQDALNRLYGGAISDTLAELKDHPSTGREGGILELVTETGGSAPQSTDQLIRLTEEGPVMRVTNAILTQGVTLRASDILIEPFEKRLRIRYRVDGVFREVESPPLSMHTGIVSRIKVISSLNIAEHRLPQDGRIKFAVSSRQVDFRVSVMPSYYGEKVCLRILDKTQATLDIERLGFDPGPLGLLKAAVAKPHGMVLITGPTGSGKTTTLYSLLKMVDRPEKNIVTVEDPVEYDLPGINQVAVRQEIGLTFAAALRSILRQDPNIIMIGEIRDQETADIAVKSALTGHLVLSTLHTNDALGAVARLTNMGIQPFLIAASVLLVGAQRLPRKVCPRCREAVHPSAEMLQQLGLPAGGKYMRGKGCAECRSTGLDGRIGLLEAVPITPELRRQIEKGASTVKLREAARAAGFQTLRDHSQSKAAAGILPLEEVARTTVGYGD
ncbi:MAG: Flp pilus assembly complex ATPase component TadA [Candidatus Omnitrophica bacterium]|nr:Flp pilus assembly complex ATPase component TadA [Candidatus Omnitrophota bacterium]